jgi:hypothetical protein
MRRFIKATVVAVVLLGSVLAAPTAQAGPASAQENYWPWMNIKAELRSCLGVLRGNMTNGTPVVLWECNGHVDQQWSVVPREGSLYYEFRNKRNPNKCLGVSGRSLERGTRLVIWDCHGTNDQRWRVEPVPDANGYRIRNLNSQQFVSVLHGSTADGAHIVQWHWQNNEDQYWL